MVAHPQLGLARVLRSVEGPQQAPNRSRRRLNLSDRRSGVPAVLIPDVAITPQECESALVDGQGRGSGINIVRADLQQTPR